MKRAMIFLAAGLVLPGCGEKKTREADKAPEFRFSADFDSSLVYLELITNYVSLTADPACTRLSLATGQQAPRREDVFRALRSPGGVSSPMALAPSGPCEWTLESVAVQTRAKACAGFHNVSFVPPGADSSAGYPASPDTLDIRCRTSESGCVHCAEADSAVVHAYRLDPTRDAGVHFRFRKDP